MKLKLTKTLAAVFLFAIPQLGFGQLAPNLKSAADFAILAATEISFDGTTTTINNMDIGLYPGTSISGSYVLDGGVALTSTTDPDERLPDAKQHLLEAYLFAEASTFPAPATVSGNLGGQSLAPGIYKSTSILSVEGDDLTLDADGDENAVWIFQIASTLTTTAGGNIVLAGEAKANNVYWQVGSSATIGSGTIFQGNILALVSISMDTGSTLNGRALARNGAVTFAGGGEMNKPEESPVATDEDLLITKTAVQSTFSNVGDVIDYVIEVENTGTGTLTDIEVEDNLTGDSWTITLEPGTSETFMPSYIITEDDIVNGFVTNIATAEVEEILVSDFAVVAYEEVPPPIPFSPWALVLGGVLIAGFVFYQYRRSVLKKA
jgi:uncharacterized repeat protein (TIGR01451 family)